MNTVEKFEKIAEETISKAEGVKCSFSDFVEGLKIISEQIRDRLELAKDELQSKELEDDK